MKSWQQKIECKVCGKKVSKCALTSHLKWLHNMTYKKHFDTYIEPFEHKCPYCENERKWIGSGGRLYALTCGSKECLSKIHSDNNGGGTPESIKKIKQTKLERYGDENYQNVEKIKQTCLEKYGVDNVWKVKSIRKKCTDTLEKRTGRRTTAHGNYAVLYQNKKFDSKTEVLFYEWCIEKGKQVEHNVTKSFTYYIDGKEHQYFPDFIVDGEFIEIKGEHLIDDEGYLLDFSGQYRLVEKTNCLRENNVKIILHQKVLEKYKPSNYDKILKKCKTIKQIKEGVEIPKCPFCGEDVKIKRASPLEFTQTCCDRKCVIRLHEARKDKKTKRYQSTKKQFNNMNTKYNFNAEAVKNDLIEWIKVWFDGDENTQGNGVGCNAVIGISGGKDSTIVAALCVEALGKDRVIGVMMPNGVQKDISDSIRVCEILGIKNYTINIADSVNGVLKQMEENGIEITEQTRTNLPARIRMSSLYAVSQSNNGRVTNNCNKSEDAVGWATRFGDGAGDLSPLSELTTVEIVQIGDLLGLPYELVHKTPIDGLNTNADGSYVTDEDGLGVTYDEIHSYIRNDKEISEDARNKIADKEKKNRFKLELIPKFEPKQSDLYN